MDNQIINNVGREIIELINQDRQPEAIQKANNFIDSHPNEAEAYYFRSRAKIGWNQIDEAIDDIKKAININPSNADYYNLLGMAYTEIGNYEGAIQELNRAIHINPNDLAYKSNLSRANALIGDIETALSQLEELHKLAPDNEQIKNDLCAVYISAATNGWYYSEEDNDYYALSLEHIKMAKEFEKKAASLAPSREATANSLQRLKEAIKIASKRKYTGGWGALIFIIIFSIIMFSSGGFLMGVTGILYYFALRTPQYVTNHLCFSNKDDLNIGDRIASFFVTDGWTFYGHGVTGALMNMAKVNFIMSFIRWGIKLSLLPITVTVGLLNNYSKYHAFAYIGSMVAFISIMNLVDISAVNPSKINVQPPISIIPSVTNNFGEKT